uniref:Two pore segment channel 3 n=1 Tax=Callorhinchus milii TaxID=7868 RepID=A0A4W3JSJ3_CALMI
MEPGLGVGLGVGLGRAGAAPGLKAAFSSAHIPTEQLELAASYVSDAQYNRNIHFETSSQAIRLHKIYNHWAAQRVIYLFVLVDLLLALFEEPAVYLLPIWLVCLLTFVGRLAHFSKIIPTKVFWRDAKNICLIITIMLTLIDMTVYWAVVITGHDTVRWSRVLRPLFCVNFTESRQLRRAFRNIRHTLPEILSVFVLFMFSVAVFSLMALKLFEKRNLTTDKGAPYFTNYLDIFFELYVLVTTANSPDVMMPAYNVSWGYSIFFIVYIIINTYTFMSVFLAVVYNNYKKHLKNEVRKLVFMKHRKMVEAFNLLKVQHGSEFIILEADWSQLVRIVAPEIPSAHRALLWRVCDEDQKGYVGQEAFIQLADLLNIQVVQMKERIHPLEVRMPSIYTSAVSQFIRRMVKHRGFRYMYDFIIVVNTIFICGDEANPYISEAEWVFLTLYLIEIMLKLYTYEPRVYFAKNQFWNWYDTIIVLAALLGTVINTALKSANGYSNQQILDIVLFQQIIVYYTFAIIGMEAFKGRIRFYGSNSSDPAANYCGNPALKGTQFAADGYCKNNFNNIIHSFILLVELTVVNQWHNILFDIKYKKKIWIYFVIFHVVVVIIFINIFIAFVLEAFFVEHSLARSAVETALEKKIQELGMGFCEDQPDGQLVDVTEMNENYSSIDDTKLETRLKFKIASIRYKTVDTLLQHMFEAELKPKDQLPTLEEIEEFSPDDMVPQRPTFYSVA